MQATFSNRVGALWPSDWCVFNTPDFANLAEVLCHEAVAASEGVGLKCVIAGEPKLAPATPHTEFWFRCGQSLTIIEGSQQWTKTMGILQFTIYGPDWCDAEDLQDLGDLISKAFGRKEFGVPPDGRVVIERMVAVVLPPSGRRKTLLGIADAGFDYYSAQ